MNKREDGKGGEEKVEVVQTTKGKKYEYHRNSPNAYFPWKQFQRIASSMTAYLKYTVSDIRH